MNLLLSPRPSRVPLACAHGRRKLPPMQPPAGDDREAFLRDPDLLRAIRNAVVRRVPDAQIDDVVQRTLHAASRSEHLPADALLRRQYTLGIARKTAAEQRRKNRRQVELQHDADVDAQPAPDSETAAADLAERRDLLAKILRFVPKHEESTLRCLERKSQGESLVAIAGELGVDPEVLSRRVNRLQHRLRVTGQMLVGTLALALVVAAVWYLGRRPEEAKQPPSITPTSMPATSSSAPEVVDHTDEARLLRQRAFGECTRNQWRECQQHLYDASQLDPAGDDDPLVKAAYNDALTGVNGKGDWTPPAVRVYAPKGK